MPRFNRYRARRFGIRKRLGFRKGFGRRRTRRPRSFRRKTFRRNAVNNCSFIETSVQEVFYGVSGKNTFVPLTFNAKKFSRLYQLRQLYDRVKPVWCTVRLEPNVANPYDLTSLGPFKMVSFPANEKDGFPVSYDTAMNMKGARSHRVGHTMKRVFKPYYMVERTCPSSDPDVNTAKFWNRSRSYVNMKADSWEDLTYYGLHLFHPGLGEDQNLEYTITYRVRWRLIGD